MCVRPWVWSPIPHKEKVKSKLNCFSDTHRHPVRVIIAFCVTCEVHKAFVIVSLNGIICGAIKFKLAVKAFKVLLFPADKSLCFSNFLHNYFQLFPLTIAHMRYFSGNTCERSEACCPCSSLCHPGCAPLADILWGSWWPWFVSVHSNLDVPQKGLSLFLECRVCVCLCHYCLPSTR